MLARLPPIASKMLPPQAYQDPAIYRRMACGAEYPNHQTSFQRSQQVKGCSIIRLSLTIVLDLGLVLNVKEAAGQHHLALRIASAL
jgi:hypothetical protein